jgi:glycerate kinase
LSNTITHLVRFEFLDSLLLARLLHNTTRSLVSDSTVHFLGACIFYSAVCVRTGEGCYDAQTARGKVVAHVQSIAERYHKPVVVLCGLNKTELGVEDRVLELMSMFTREQSLHETERCIDGLLDKHWDELRLTVAARTSSHRA